jgi:hypothetical protein
VRVAGSLSLMPTMFWATHWYFPSSPGRTSAIMRLPPSTTRTLQSYKIVNQQDCLQGWFRLMCKAKELSSPLSSSSIVSILHWLTYEMSSIFSIFPWSFLFDFC